MKSQSPKEALTYILTVVGTISFLTGLCSYMPTVFVYSFPLGLVYLGIVMVLVGAIVERI